MKSIHKNKLYLILLSLIAMPNARAMEEKKKEVIEGYLSIIPERPKYAQGMMFHKEIEAQLGTKLQETDVLVTVQVTSDECPNWNLCEHPRLSRHQRFPYALLYRTLKDKKDEDVFDLPLFNKIFRLRVCQSKCSFKERSFENWLAGLKNSFLRNPNFNIEAEEVLLKQGIIVKLEEDHNFPKYAHGPNGFKDE